MSVQELLINCSRKSLPLLDETYSMEIYTEDHQLLYNVSDSESPKFIATSLPPSSKFSILVYATNVKGQSERLVIVAHTGDSPKVESSKSK